MSCFCMFLDGFVLIFIGYNTSILSKQNKWEGHRLILIDVIYHLVSAFGGILSIFTSAGKNIKLLSIGLFTLLIAFVCSLYLIGIKKFPLYLIIFFVIGLSNGHIQNICTTQIVKKFSHSYRASIYVIVYTFTQFGKFFFALILFKKNDTISKGNITPTVYPITVILFMLIISYSIMLFFIRRKKNLKESYLIRHQSRRESIFNNLNLFVTYGNSFVIGDAKFKSLSKLFRSDLFETNLNEHALNLLFLNLSLGIQFFSMINVFPLINGKNTTVTVDEIFWSKSLHTMFLLFIPAVYLFKLNSRKFLLFMTFAMSLFLNVLIFLDVFNSTLVIHLFRFIWNVCYITVNLYCAEAATNQMRGINTAFMYLIFKLSCIIEIVTIDKLIAVSIYVPIMLNIIILIGDMMLVSKLKVETHFKTIEEIEGELNELKALKQNSYINKNLNSDSQSKENTMLNVY